MLGTLTAGMNGNMFTFDLKSQNAFSTPSSPDFIEAKLIYTSSNGTIYQTGLGSNTSPNNRFYGGAVVYTLGNNLDNTCFAVQQTSGWGTSQGVFEFWVIMPMSPGKGFFTVKTNQTTDRFTYSGTTSLNGPTTCYITPVQGTLLGPTGPVGQIGSQGQIGTTGYTGYTGRTGAIGFTGYTGRTGYTGYTGRTGSTGQTGPFGLGDVFDLPTGGSVWYLLGTVNTTQNGSLFRLDLNTQNYYC